MLVHRAGRDIVKQSRESQQCVREVNISVRAVHAGEGIGTRFPEKSGLELTLRV